SSYDKQKSQLEKELCNFLSSLDPPKSILSCIPQDIVRFLVWKDRKGKTKVHRDGCSPSTSRTKNTCSCPTRLASGTVDSIIGKLRTILKSAGRTRE
ncbi:predicted protein, partial [Nematostella vectensis]